MAVVRSRHQAAWSPREQTWPCPAAGTARLKTGTLRNGVALAGTLSDAGGQPLIEVASISHEPLDQRQARSVLDGVIDWVARSRFRPPTALGAGN